MRNFTRFAGFFVACACLLLGASACATPTSSAAAPPKLENTSVSFTVPTNSVVNMGDHLPIVVGFKLTGDKNTMVTLGWCLTPTLDLSGHPSTRECSGVTRSIEDFSSGSYLLTITPSHPGMSYKYFEAFFTVGGWSPAPIPLLPATIIGQLIVQDYVIQTRSQ